MKRNHLGSLTSAIITLAVIVWLVSQKKGFWWYVGTLLIISPLGYSIGYALGKDDPEDKKRQDELAKQAGVEADRIGRCKDLGGMYSLGQCKKFTAGGMQTINLS